MTHVLVLIAAGLALLYVGLLVLLWRFQEQIVFQPPRGVAPSDVSARQVHYAAEDGTSLFAFIVGDCNPTSTLVLAFHGNADLARWFVPWASELARTANTCVMIPEYRGYDGLGGNPSYAASAYDARAALAFARDSLGVRSDHLVYYGHSLGTAIATELAASDPPRALVLQSPFTSARDMSRRLSVPGVSAFWALISRVHFETANRVRALTMPVSVAHGDKDLIIPIEMGRTVFNAAKHPGELLVVPGAGHNDVAEIGGRAYWTWLAHAVHAGDPASPSLDARAKTRSAP